VTASHTSTTPVPKNGSIHRPETGGANALIHATRHSNN